jgi:uncharacterized protein YjbI with pentapeptide repeats
MSDDKLSARKRTFIIGGAVATIFSGIFFKNGVERIMKSEISDMNEQYSLLMNINLRRSKLASARLSIKNASFTKNIKQLECENTEFINCDFYDDVVINIKSLHNVEFRDCNIRNSKISSGFWKDVTFNNVHASGEFEILGDEGSSNVVFKNCNLNGPAFSEEGNHENTFGAAGTYGTAEFIDCDIKYVGIEGPVGLIVKNSRLNKIKAIAQRKHGYITLENVEIKEYFNLTSGIFSNINIKNTRFDYLDMEKVKSDSLLIQDSSGHFFGKLMTTDELTVRRCTFIAEGDPENISQHEDAGFSTIYSKIRKLTIENVKFSGRNGNLFIGGSINILFNEKQPEYGPPIEYTTYGEIFLKDTSLKNSSLSFLDCDELRIENCGFENTNFSKSRVRNLEIINCTFSGKVDFSGTIIKGFSEARNVKEPSLRMIQDVNKFL